MDTEDLGKSRMKSWFSDLKTHLLPEPDSLSDVMSLLKMAVDKKLIDHDTGKMIEGVMAISQMQVRDIMVPRSQMTVLEHDQPVEALLKTISEASHSRFPVVGENKDDVIGMLLVKDFLKAYLYEGNTGLDLPSILRPAYFVPESKRLDSLLNEFKENHYHLAVVVDEYGGIAGLITIEDILEEIVGDIEDEFDEDEAHPVQEVSPGVYHVYALMSLDDMNQALGTDFQDENVDTLGGLLSHHLGHIPATGETLEMGTWKIKVLKADSRRVLQAELRQNDLDKPENSA